MATSITITASEGMLLHNGAGLYAKEVIVPIGVVWEEVINEGQMDGVIDIEYEPL